ncbi:polysaccharide deacetylase family protein [Nocardioides taihuensis]|uniref:Polysaccharide deacetylase n=1 Tax=Nocardioides taihuensis TaxID=1835606 RepID=A0ABW0BQA3_9ACTN
MTTPPPGTTSSASFTFDLDAEEVWLAEDPTASRRPVLLSQGAYGPRVGLPAVLGLLRAHGVRATFFVPGRVAETYPAAVESVLEAGHEVAHHGHTHRAPAELSLDEEVDEFERGLAALRHVGVVPTGYRAPSWDFSPHTLGLVADHGFDYSSNFMDEVRPYVHPSRDVVELPVHWTLDDAAHYWFAADTWTKKISTNGEVEQIMVAEADGIAAMHGCAVYTLHPQIIGRPGRLPLLDELLRRAASDPSVWVATAAEIAAHTRKQES